MQRSIAIIYGLNEGPALSKRLRRAARQRGFDLTTDINNADVVISHSGGCFFIAENNPNQVVLIANPICGPRRRVPLLLFIKIFHDFVSCARTGKLHAWAHKTAWNAMYSISRAAPNIKMIRAAGPFLKSLPNTNAKKVFVVNNRADPWASCVPAEAVKARPEFCFMTLPGSHDDLWIHPEKYLDIIQS